MIKLQNKLILPIFQFTLILIFLVIYYLSESFMGVERHFSYINYYYGYIFKILLLIFFTLLIIYAMKSRNKKTGVIYTVIFTLFISISKTFFRYVHYELDILVFIFIVLQILKNSFKKNQ